MRVNGLFALAESANVRMTLFQKVLFASLILTLLVASFSVNSVLAAKSNPQHADLEQAWSNKLRMLRLEAAIANRMTLTPAQIQGCSRQEQAMIIAGTFSTTANTQQNQSGTNTTTTTTTGQQFQGGTGNINRSSCFFKWEQAQNRMDRYRSILGQAQALIINSGFDANGFVTDAKQARLSLNTLGTYLSTLRNIRQNISEMK